MSLKKYIVNVREVYIQPVLIEASSEEEAITKVANGEGKMFDNSIEHDYTLDPDKWTVSSLSSYLLQAYAE